MRTVDHDGDSYLLLAQSDESSLVRDPETGEERHLPNEELTASGESPLVLAARRVPEPARRLLAAVPSERALGVLVELDERGPMAVRAALSAYDLCESDLHGLFGELRAAGLVAEADVDGRRGYRLTERGVEALEAVR